jgi:multidrug resistance efflux pump
LKRALIILGILVVAAVGLAFWQGWPGQAPPENELRLSGKIQTTETDVAFRIPGKIAALKVEEGQEVTAGKVVAELEKQDLQQELEVAEAKVALAQATPRPTNIKNAELRVARAYRDLAKIRLEYATLASPVNGLVLVRPASPGEVVNVGATVLTVGDLDNIWFEGYLPETDLARVRFGQEAAVTTDSYPGKEYRGRVSFIAAKPEFTPKTVETQKERGMLVYRVKIRMPNPNRELKPGMPARAVLRLEKQ